MEHPAFAEAGEAPGIEIWTIDKFEPVAIERKLYGKFYNGDSYIVLKTTGVDASSPLSYDVHFWLGAKTTQDKKGAAAILTITLDDKLGGKAVHHREVQGHETSQFLGYFQPAIRYLEGGNESGFTEVETNAGAEKRLLRLSGCDNMRIEEVPADSSSLSKEHCFILEVEHDIFVLMPEGAKATHRRKIISVANSLRDDYHNGRATIEIIDEFSSEDDINMFFEALGSGSMDELLDDDSSDGYTRENISTVYLYKVLMGEELELVAVNKPFKQKQLSSEDVFILDTPDSGVYIWLGQELDPDVKKNYNDIAQQYLDIKGYPSWVAVTRVSEGAESSAFKQYFHTWDTVTAAGSVRALAAQIDSGYFSCDAEESLAQAKYIGKSAAARGYMPDGGAGALTVIRVSDEQEDITESFTETPKLYRGEVYVLKYAYSNEDGQDATVVYLWLGSEASLDAKKAGLELVSELEDEDDKVTIVTLPQGKETKHFLNIFKGGLMVLCGSKEDDYKVDNFRKSYDDDGIRLFRVEGTVSNEDTRATQIPENADQLEDDDVYILETPDVVYVWNGKESHSSERESGLSFVSALAGDKEVVEVEQGDEPDEFWDALGGAPEPHEDSSGWKLAVNRRVQAPVSLTAISVKASGKIKFEELPPDFAQTDLADDGIYILDTGEELYMWQGKNISERVKNARRAIVGEYIEDDGLDRTVESVIVVSLKQGNEPAIFKKLFVEWDDNLWENQQSYEDIKNETREKN
ncbi:gelsolin-like [Aricia agestis]|uniref:gelsolin-like n=1 Tax=Aricia agestis TaxID=91739 RepID=UPI001C2045F8|nr:gelsolin-like [Aricia agestis]